MNGKRLCMFVALSACGCDVERNPFVASDGIVATEGRASIGNDRSHGYLGLLFESIDEQPLIVSGCVPGSGAESADIRAGDLLIDIDGHSNPTFRQIHQVVAKLEPGDEIVATVERNNTSLSIRFSLISFDDVQSAMQIQRDANNHNSTEQ